MSHKKTHSVKSDFAHKKIEKCTLGARLRTLRKVEGLSQDELAQRSRVRRAYIEALEDGRYGDVPAVVYVHGFLRAIAEVLRTRPEQLITLYDREVGIEENIGKKGGENAQNLSPQRPQVHLYRALFTPRQIIFIASVLFAIGGTFYLFTVLRSFVSAPFIVISSPEEGVMADSAEVSVEGVTDPSAKLSIAGQDVVVGQDGRFQTRVFLRDGVNDIPIRATNRFEKMTQKVLSLQYRSAQQDLPEERVAIQPQPHRLFVRIKDARTWLDVRVDGETILARTVDVGFEDVFEGDEIVITSGGGTRTEVSRDGATFEPLSPVRGLVKDVVFTRTDTGK